MTSQVVRIGELVHRSPHPRSAYVGELLQALPELGFRAAPAYLGGDERGRDRFTFLPGRISGHASERAEAAYPAGGRLLRALHRASAGHPLAGDQPCVIHTDPGPWNTLFIQGMPHALIDWDGARPGHPLQDLAYMAWTWCVRVVDGSRLEDEIIWLREMRNGYSSAVSGEALIEAIFRSLQEGSEWWTERLSTRIMSEKERQHAMESRAWNGLVSSYLRAKHATFLRGLR